MKPAKPQAASTIVQSNRGPTARGVVFWGYLPFPCFFWIITLLYFSLWYIYSRLSIPYMSTPLFLYGGFSFKGKSRETVMFSVKKRMWFFYPLGVPTFSFLGSHLSLFGILTFRFLESLPFLFLGIMPFLFRNPWLVFSFWPLVFMPFAFFGYPFHSLFGFLSFPFWLACLPKTNALE